MPLYLGQDNAGTSSYSLQDFEPSWGTKMNAAVRESWLESYGPAAADYLSSRVSQGDQQKLSAVEAADEIKKSGVKLGKSIGDGQYTKTQLSVLLERQRELTAIKDVRERTPWDASSVVRGVGMFGAGIVDPINLATAFVPWTRSMSVLNSARAGLTAESALTRAGSRALLGGADAGISTAVLEPAYSFVRNEIGDDYGAMDSMANIAFGTAFGGGLHVIGGGIGDAFKMRRDGMVTPNPAADPIAPPVGTVPGGDTRIRIGETYEPAKWSVIDADQLTATVGKADNQYRDRTRAAYQTEIQQRANNLDFNLLAESPVMDFGAPTLAADGRIIGGNGRALFISKAYEIGKGADYKAALEARMADLGIDPESVRGMVKPVLVRVLQREVDVKRAAMLSNEGGSTDMSPLEQAKVDAERLGEAQLVVGTDGDLNAPENRGVVRKWLEAQPENKRNSLVDEDGRLSATGIQRLNSALLFKAYGDSPTLGRLIESMDPGSRNLAMALGRTAPVLANARGAIASGDLHPLDIAGDIQQAVEKFNALRSSGMKVADYMAQLDAFGDGLTPEATMLLDFMGRNIASPRRMADAITGFYDRLNEAGNPKQGDIFGGVSAPDKMGMLEASLRAAEDGMDSAAEVAAVVSPETREATLRASVAQSVDGRMVDVDAIVGMDEAVGTSTRADANAAADRTYQPENVALADFEASTAVQSRLDTAPKWEAVKDAEDALAEADTMLAETVKAGDQAFKYSRGEAPGQKKATLWQGTTARFGAEDGKPLGGFRWDFINSDAGEGAQAFGYGHYLAQQAWISQTRYRERLTDRKRDQFDLTGSDAPESLRYRAMANGEEVPLSDEALRMMRNITGLGSELNQTIGRGLDAQSNRLAGTNASGKVSDLLAKINEAGYPDVEKELRDLLARGIDEVTIERPGSLYRAEMEGADFANLMLWDAPLSEQPAKVRKAFERFGVSEKKDIKWVEATSDDWYTQNDIMRIQRNGVGRFVLFNDGRIVDAYATLAEAKEAASTTSSKTAERAYKELIQKIKDGVTNDALDDAIMSAHYEIARRRFGRNVDDSVDPMEAMDDAGYTPGNDEIASVILNNAGIPGHAFLDGVSRGAADAPAYNIVIYSDDVAKIVDRYSRQTGEIGRATDTAEGLTEALRLSFGRVTEDLLNAGNVRVVSTVDELPGGPHPQDVKAMAVGDKVYVVAANVAESEARGLMLHEVGVHVGMERMMGAEAFEAVLKELDDAILRGEDWALRARSYVPDDTLPAHVREEQLAYLVEFAPELPIVQRIIAAIRAWAYRTFEFARDSITLTEADFRAMAVAGLVRAAERADMRSPIPAYSRPGGAADQFRRFLSANRDYVENGLRRRLLASSDNYVIREVPLNSVRLLQSGDEYINDSSRYTADQIRRGTAAERRPEDVFPIRLSKDGTVLDGHHRHAAASINGEISILALVPAGPGTGKVLNLGDFGGTAVDAPKYSRGETQDPSTVKDELKLYDDAVKRAQQYASVLRAAADKLANDAQATEAMRAAMPDITPAEVTDLLDQLRRQVKGLRGVARTARDALRSEDVANDLQSDAMKAADQLANNLEMAAVIEKRNAALNMNVRLKATAYVNQFREAGLDFEGFRGLLVGTERKRAGGRISVEGEQKNFRGEWLGGMIADLEKGDLMRQFTSGEFDREISVALWNLGKKGDNSKLAPEAVKIAEIVNKYQTDARNTRNRFGAWIRDLNGYITRQSHDMLKIRDAGEKAFKEFVLPRLDLERSLRDFDGTADDFLTRVYDDFATGSHMKTVAGEDDMVALGRGSSLARRESVSRVLYFKDGNASFEYNDKFGQGRLAESVLQGLDQAGKSAGLLKMLGTNPEATVTRLFDEYAESLRGDPERRAKFLSYRKELSNMLAQVDGSVNIPGNVTAAKISSFLRSWQSMAKLGGALISSVTDLAGYAAELRFGQDKNLLSGTLDGIGALVQGRAKGEKQQILSSLGVFHESTLGSVFARFDSPDLMGGKMSAAMQMFFKLNGLNWWTESLRDGYALTHSHYLATNTGKAFDKLPDALRDMLGLYNIDAGKWDILRIATMSEADGRQYMTPDALRTVPRAALENYITSIGRTVSDASVANLQDDLSSALRTMTIDRMHHAVLEPSARTRAFMLRGTQPGTVPGELLRFIGQFKSFPVALVQSTLGREVYGRGYDTLGDYLKNGKGDMVGLATFIALSTAMGYSAMAAKDLLRGKNPRPLDDPRTWAAAMVQGGGLGLYGDFLFQKYNRMGGTLSGSMLGPVANVVDTVADLWTRIRTGDDVAATAFNAALQNTPFMNLFYTRTALDYLVLYKIQEALNPGFLRRMERRAERENGQTFFMPPTSVAQ